MNIRTFITSALFSLIMPAVSAQDIVEKMNAIKLDTQYVYGEASHENADTAFQIALSDLKIYLEVSKRTTVEISKLKRCVQSLSRPRGQRVKVLVYAKVQDLLNTSASAPPTVAAPTPQPAAQPAPQPAQQVAAQPETQAEMSENTQPILGSLVNELMETEHLQEALLVLEAHKKRGTLREIKPYSKAGQPKTMYLLIFDREYNIPLAVLSPEKPSGKRDNLNKRSEESLSDYSDKIAVCFSF